MPLFNRKKKIQKKKINRNRSMKVEGIPKPLISSVNSKKYTITITDRGTGLALEQAKREEEAKLKKRLSWADFLKQKIIGDKVGSSKTNVERIKA